MSSLEAKKIAPATGTTVTLGAAGDTVAVSASALKTDVWKDAGSNALFTSDGSGTLSGVNSGFGNSLNYISSVTASDSATVAITSNIDSTYDEYRFVFTNINTNVDYRDFQFQCSIDAGSNYNIAMTTTTTSVWHGENNSGQTFGYRAGTDQSQGTSYQSIGLQLGAGADENSCGILTLYNPSSTTYVKNFTATSSNYQFENRMYGLYAAGYFNTTSAINAISFKFSAGNIQSGTIAMYGVG